MNPMEAQTFAVKAMVQTNQNKCSGMPEPSSDGKTEWFNAGAVSPVRDGYYELRAIGHRADQGKWSFHPWTDGYHPVWFDAECVVWRFVIAGMGVLVFPVEMAEWLSALEWRGLTRDAYVYRNYREETA